mmetsp:Transcript_119707/g.343913  ORF Transcript_119707/g.343913 Transcript_119707/m.343913 type:complete len:215 (+) Transcript_119707:1076-1720(+)
MSFAEEQCGRLLRHLGSVNDDVDGRLPRADHENTLVLGGVLGDVRRRVHHKGRAFHFLLRPTGPRRHLAVHPGAEHHKIEFVDGAAAQLQNPTFLAPRPRLHPVDGCVKIDVREQLVVVREGFDVCLGLRARRVLAPLDGLEGEVRELIELLRDLHAVGVVVLSPQTADFGRPVVDLHLVPVSDQGPRHLQTGYAGADHAHGAHIREIIGDNSW